MKTTPERMLEAVLAARERGYVRWREQGAYYQRVEGGANNALYRIRQNGERFACKIYVNDERRRGEREFRALKTLQEAGYDLAPAPRLYVGSAGRNTHPALIYSWVEGSPVCGEPNREQLDALLASLQAVHSMRPGTAPSAKLIPAFFHWPELSAYTAEISLLMESYGGWLETAAPDGSELHQRIAELIRQGLANLRQVTFRSASDSGALCLVHVDTNLSNILWGPDGRVRWVDWEYAGWGDPAMDLAEFAWHAALEHWSPDAQAWLRANYYPAAEDRGFSQRLAAWDVVLALRWPLIVLRDWWSIHNGPDRARLSQRREPEEIVRARFERYLKRGEDLADTL